MQVPLDGARAEEEPRPDLRVREPVAGQLGDLVLLRGQIVVRLDGPFADPLARRQKLLLCALGERLHANRVELVVAGAELGARVDPAILAAQPLAVEQMSACELGT